jgi:hypothetical protein
VERAKAQQDRFRLLLELALCPVSEDKIVRYLETAFGQEGRVSVEWDNSQLLSDGEAAPAVTQLVEASLC